MSNPESMVSEFEEGDESMVGDVSGDSSSIDGGSGIGISV